MSELALRIGNQDYLGWQEVSVTRGIAQVAGTFELRLTDKWALDRSQIALLPGLRAQVLIDNQVVITGWLDDVEANHGPTEHVLSVRGRDATGDLVDCAAIHASQEWVGRNLLQVATDLLKPFDISVVADVDVGAPFKYNHAQPGETVFELLERAARFRGVLLVSDGNGGLRITRAGKSRATQSLELGANILRGRSMLTQRDRYSLYQVLAQKRADDFTLDSTAAAVKAEVKDSGIKRYRPTVIQSSDPIDIEGALTRAQWERSIRAGRSSEGEVGVRGWLDGKAPWQPNALVTVRDPWLGLDGEYLISTVTYRLSQDSGEVTDLALTPPGAFEVRTEVETDPNGDSAAFSLEGVA